MAPVVDRELLVTYGSVQVDNVEAGNGVYNLASSQPKDWIVVGIKVAFYNCSNSANNGLHTVTGVSGTAITTDNTSSVVEASSPGLAAFPVGGTSDFELTGIHRKSKEYPILEVSIDCVFAGVADVATFDKYADAIETAFRVPDQRLRVVLDSTVIDDYNPSSESGGNTGFLQAPNISKPSDPRDTGRSRFYTISVSMEMPADKPGDDGRRVAQESVVYDSARARTVTFSGQYTALGANGALAQYSASHTSYCTGRLVSYGGSAVYEIVAEEASPDKEDKLLDGPSGRRSSTLSRRLD